MRIQNWILVVFVVYQGCPSHILSMTSIEQPYTFGIPIARGASTNNMSPLNDGANYLTSCIPMMSKFIVVRSNFETYVLFVFYVLRDNICD